MSDKIRAAFLDRDGTLIEEKNYLKDPAKVELLPGGPEALLALRAKGYRLFLVSNQSGVGRGTITKVELQAVHLALEKKLGDQGVALDDFWYCPHSPDHTCFCRKPSIGLVPKTWRGKTFDFASSIVVGDKLSDLQFGKNLGTRSFLVLTGYGEQTRAALPVGHGFTVASSLLEVSRLV